MCLSFTRCLYLSQENFELNHETLYLAVKLTDHYLAAVPSLSRDLLQLVGSTAMLIAAKFEVSLAVPNKADIPESDIEQHNLLPQTTIGK